MVSLKSDLEKVTFGGGIPSTFEHYVSMDGPWAYQVALACLGLILARIPPLHTSGPCKAAAVELL